MFFIFESARKLFKHSLTVTAVTLPLLLISVFYFDTQIAEYFKRPEQEQIYYYSREITNTGYSIHYFVIGILGLIFSKLLYAKIPALKNYVSEKKAFAVGEWSFFLIKALFLVAIPLHILKFSFGRLRPHMSEGFNNLNFEPFNFHHHWHSFPSGHSQVLFTAATVAALALPRFRFGFLGLAFLLAMTRVTIQQHFFSDVIAGALVGYLGTLWLYYYLPPKVQK